MRVGSCNINQVKINMPQKKVLTSAVPGFTVAEVRKHLASTRALWAASDSETAFGTYHQNGSGMTAGRFAFLFVLGHHRKRHRTGIKVKKNDL